MTDILVVRGGLFREDMFMIKKIILLMLFSPIFSQHFEVTINPTGDSHLVILLDSVAGLDIGDEVGVFDLNGVLSTVDAGVDPEYGEVLVASGIWDGESNAEGTAMELSAIVSVDLSDFNGPILNGAIEDNIVSIKVFDTSEGLELETTPTFTSGGEFGNLFTVISELEIIQPEPLYGCTDSDACNFDQDANTDDGSCLYDDCTGECGGDAIVDDCGVCGGDDSTCEVYIESSVETSVDESLLADLDTFEEDFESFIETELDLPEESVEVTDITVNTTSRDDVDITIDYTITLTEQELAESDFTGEDDINEALEDTESEIEDGLPEFVYGCTDDSADNYNSDASVDDGSCEYPAQAPEEFYFNISTLGAYYFMIDANIDGEPLEIGQDYVAAFNGDICVGNIAWDGAYTTVPAMGDDGDDYSEGYLLTGDVPTFKIYDASEDIIIEACPETEESLDFSNLEFIYIDMLNGNQSCTVSYDIPMHYGANLVSFHALPEDVSVGNVMESLGDAVTGVIGEGVAASPNPVLGWVGSLEEIERNSGYWIKLVDTISLELSEATATDPEIIYSMHYGANLISFPIAGSVGIGNGIPDDVEEFFTGVIGEGVAASPNPVLGWVGSLSEFEGTKGYWAKVDNSFTFSYDLSNASSDRVSINEELDIPYEFTQSTQQAFYFIENIDAEISNGDWILAYNNGVLVGSRQWNGVYTDVPAMGYYDISTSGYCETGDTPQFIWIDSDGNDHLLTGNIPEWSNNGLYNISLGLDSEGLFPNEYNLIQNYPNPFNPSTTISFTIPIEDHVTLNVHDMSGKLVKRLIDHKMNTGYHNVSWNGKDANGLSVSSGLYVYTLSTKNISLSGKMMLMK